MSEIHNAPETLRMRSKIQEFLGERLQAKLDKLKPDADEERAALIAAYAPATWLPDAAKRAGQIQQVSHAIKFTHPSAGGSSLSSTGNPHAGADALGSHSLPADGAQDVVGNAAALDVYKFLRLEVDGKTLLARALAADPALAAALSDTPEEGAAWMAAFAELPQPKGRLASHTLAKQIYWPVGEGAYHLLAPLYSSTLAHAVYGRVRDDLWGAGKAAHEAKQAQRAWTQGYHSYDRLVIQSFGGSKPQNISQLNSERRGENYLLPSCPPQWVSAGLKPPLGVESVFLARRQLGGRREVRRLVQVLKTFLGKLRPEDNNIRIRETRRALVASLVDEVLQMGALYAELPSGWSADGGCLLDEAECCWLDPYRARGDEAFAAQRRRGDWLDVICKRFAQWLNAQLGAERFGDAEALQWRTDLKQELKMLRDALEDDHES
ncbi:type I-F CRISPR-associated protein Csy1 [Zoogloea sp.]|uniref:type I-F CRISPR-associated protein Csy1 n=1 Tax=Zoogloea sp. TaxID=49181 RepID=UPI0035B2A91B